MKEFFFKILNECYLVTNDSYPDSIFYIYDKQAIRQKKLNRILNRNITNFNIKNGELIFKQDYKNNVFWVSENLWEKFLFLEYNQIQTLIRTWIIESSYFTDFNLTPHKRRFYYDIFGDLYPGNIGNLFYLKDKKIITTT